MKYKLSKFRMTIPQEIRTKANIDGEGYVDISYDEATGNIIISSQLKPELEVTPEKAVSNNEPKKKSTNKSTKKSTKSAKPRKIEANFEDANKLYKAYFSECGLVVRTKNRYINDFCNDCQGQLAKEWEDRVEVQCKYLKSDFSDVIEQVDKAQENLEKSIQEEIEKVEEVKQEITESANKDKFDEIRKKRKEDISSISNSIKIANKVIDKEIESIEPKQKRGRPKKQSRYSTSTTVLKPVKTGTEKFLNCVDCGEFVSKGFYVDDDFLCKACAVKDFKEFIKRRGM